ncbi:hypothetical protein FJR48_06535 [Sulfurimonas lithotrophica]|uniref:Excisionase n=1 Tax=Sulfurimonas lithotrophica TaxID=2590022 RepID=A0A5P8P192_9BACT|nr:hypothetical protein [Sulfurimonas lithotrophica]QFR49400.1 hypothetical protein FJR48_06535 [Sulfurimonas lithotrophica]
MNIESKYLSTSKISRMVDINERWLREHQGTIFKEGVHYYYPNGFKNCRWNVSAMIEWIENPNEESNIADEILSNICVI